MCVVETDAGPEMNGQIGKQERLAGRIGCVTVIIFSRIRVYHVFFVIFCKYTILYYYMTN